VDFDKSVSGIIFRMETSPFGWPSGPRNVKKPLFMSNQPQAPSDDDKISALFVQLVMQQTNMALMLLGQIANPNTGETLRDPQAARFFIDALEMLEVKTRGNLSRDEAELLKHNLMALHLAFVEAINAPADKTPPAAAPAPNPAAEPAPAPEKKTAPDESGAAPEKKFSKKY
jgi:hypothetical protein